MSRPRDGNHKNNHMINIFKVFKKMLSFVFRIVNMNVNLRTYLSVSSFLEHLSKRCSLLPFAGGRWPVWSCVRHLRGDLSPPTSCQSRIRSYFPTKTIFRSPRLRSWAWEALRRISWYETRQMTAPRPRLDLRLIWARFPSLCGSSPMHFVEMSSMIASKAFCLVSPGDSFFCVAPRPFTRPSWTVSSHRKLRSNLRRRLSSLALS